MCQSNAYMVDSGGNEELVLEDVAHVEVGKNVVRLETLFGEPVSIRASIREIDLMKHKIVLERVEDTLPFLNG